MLDVGNELSQPFVLLPVLDKLVREPRGGARGARGGTAALATALGPVQPQPRRVRVHAALHLGQQADGRQRVAAARGPGAAGGPVSQARAAVRGQQQRGQLRADRQCSQHLQHGPVERDVASHVQHRVIAQV